MAAAVREDDLRSMSLSECSSSRSGVFRNNPKSVSGDQQSCNHEHASLHKTHAVGLPVPCHIIIQTLDNLTYINEADRARPIMFLVAIEVILKRRGCSAAQD